MTDKITRVPVPGGELVIDRTHDCPYPGWPDANYAETKRECPTCSHRGAGPMYQIVMLDVESGRLLKPPKARWYWNCFGCGRMDEGGSWIPRTAEEYHYSRWQAAQEKDNVGPGPDSADPTETDPEQKV